ncbi:UDP-N-acetyl-D-mannosamine dehydrogenase [Listeria newyorkensis]|uniref:UDP-N-acetyl-D-mannosamine dehydrogenase n=1 Tax=Listeria newyorkensis TaxID=1497681 RepID=A0ABX4XPW7_9LIST|nr:MULTISPECIES: nucleotide sugar dehydrogenase [Listeria]KGL41292.1 UDP-N-acetyl-D-mannosamine dehydrogenase [Listeriaceae bacterium FSL A5-0209]KGL44628.1 UDP-N-acetyl-D-mannosamine dehydrogenase [Listeria newyorkensis]KMT62322.1 capsular polysaccharide synthesis enzyme [Listeria newyorkensis]PNP93858.1 UDP-N-acetyl-D-mannosamine dehydrogenase [Listeria newyorkensis]RQW67360.1 nucleotide sugar dehydrogenase [Listeria sp. SHR_NRA_18]
MKITVVGLGYIGLPTAILFAKYGNTVTGVDLSPIMTENLNMGHLHIEEPGLEEDLKQALALGNFHASTVPVSADAYIIAVPTPNKDDLYKSCDTAYIESALASIMPHLKKNDTIIVESTIAPRTMADVVQPMIENAGFTVGEDIYLAHCPERVLPGNIMHELVHNPRIIGGITAKCTEKAAAVYGAFVEGEIIKAEAGEAELSKLMENTYRDVNIALANELAKISNHLEIDALRVIEMANKHPRVNLHQPGPGVGGHCLAVDPYFVIAAAPEQSPLMQTARAVNNSMPAHVVSQVKSLMAEQDGNRVTIFGLTYKGNIDDTRESPAMEIKDMLIKSGFDVKAFDPHVASEILTGEEACEDSSLLLVLSDHSEFREIPASYTDQMRTPILFDTKNMVQTVSDDVTYLNYGNLHTKKQAISI